MIRIPRIDRESILETALRPEITVIMRQVFEVLAGTPGGEKATARLVRKEEGSPSTAFPVSPP